MNCVRSSTSGWRRLEHSPFGCTVPHAVHRASSAVDAAGTGGASSCLGRSSGTPPTVRSRRSAAARVISSLFTVKSTLDFASRSSIRTTSSSGVTCAFSSLSSLFIDSASTAAASARMPLLYHHRQSAPLEELVRALGKAVVPGLAIAPHDHVGQSTVGDKLRAAKADVTQNIDRATLPRGAISHHQCISFCVKRNAVVVQPVHRTGFTPLAPECARKTFVIKTRRRSIVAGGDDAVSSVHDDRTDLGSHAQ